MILVLSSVGFLFPCHPLCVPWLPLCLSVRGKGGATRVTASTGLEEDDDEGAVAGQNLLSSVFFYFGSCSTPVVFVLHPVLWVLSLVFL